MAQPAPVIKDKSLVGTPLLLLTDPDTLAVEFLNHSADFPVDQLGEAGNSGFFERVVHPQDYPDLVAHLLTCKTLLKQEEKEILIRLKLSGRKWIKCSVKSQHHSRKADDHRILNILQKTRATKKVDRNKNLADKEYLHFVNSLDEGFAVLEMIYDKAGDPVDYLYIQINPAFEKQVNFKNVVGKRVTELVKVPNQRWLKAFAKVAKTGKPVRFEEFNPNLDDSWLNLYAFKIGGPESNRVGTLFRNVTAQKLAEIELEEAKKALEKSDAQSTMLLQSVFETTNLGIGVLGVVSDKKGDVIDFEYLRVNKILQGMYADVDPLGKTMLQVSKHSVQLGLFAAFKEVAKTGNPLDTEIFFDKDGYNNWFRITAIPQKDLLIISIEDITKRKKESIELEENVRFKKQLVRTSPETIMIINLNTFTVRYINKDLVPEIGMTKERIQGISLPEVLPYVHPRDREKLMDMHRKLLKSSEKDILDLELRLKLDGNSWQWFSVRAKIFHRRDAEWVDEYVLLVRNITEVKLTQKALLKAEKFSIQGEIARTLAHELRNPLASMKMASAILDKKLKDSEDDSGRYLNILSRSTDTLNNLVTNLLNSSNYSPSELKKIDLAKVVKTTLERAADRIYLSGIQVMQKFKGPYFILGDEEKLEIAILNIIVNASEATTPGEGIIKIEISEEKTDYKLDIADNGHGLDDNQIEHLFEAFYTNKNSGVGVGLSSVKNILEEHDAQIKVKSKPNEGTCFSLYFNNINHQ